MPNPAPAPAPVTKTEQDFKIFNAMLYRNMPTVGSRIATVYEQAFFPNGQVAANGRPTNHGIWNAVANAHNQAGAPWFANAPLVAMDIERWYMWPWVTGDAHRESATRYADSARMFRAALGQPVCYYSVAPFGGIVHSTLAARDPAVQAEWDLHNDVIGELVVPEIDALCPQLYTYYDDASNPAERQRYIDQWKLFARQTIDQGRRIGQGKPIYPFIWPQFHHGGMFKDARPLSEAYWRAELETIKEHADGVILWGGWNFDNNTQLPWDESAMWWRVFQEVMFDGEDTEPG